MWFLSPSGWPTFADSLEEQADLVAAGYVVIDASQVQAAIDAYNAGTPPPVTDVPTLDGPNTWTGTQDFTGAAVTGLATGGGLTDASVAALVPDTDTATGAALEKAFEVSLNPLNNGAVGDGTADDTASLQAALDAAKTRGLGWVNGGGRTYKVTGRLTVDSVMIHDAQIALVGATANIRQTGTKPALRFCTVTADSTPADEWGPDGAAINLFVTTDALLDNVTVTATAQRRAVQCTTRADHTRVNALRTHTAWGILYNDSSFIDRTNIEGVDYSGQSIGTGLTVTNSDFFGPSNPAWTGDAIEINVPAMRFSHANMENTRVWRTYTSDQTGIGFGFANVDHVTVDGCYVENCPSPAGAYHAEFCTDVKFTRSTAFNVRCGVDIAGVLGAKITGNRFDSCWEFSLKSQGTSTTTVDLDILDNTFVGLKTANGVTGQQDINIGNVKMFTIARNKFLGQGEAGLTHINLVSYGTIGVTYGKLVDNLFADTLGFAPTDFLFVDSAASGLFSRGNNFTDILAPAGRFIARVAAHGISEDFYRAGTSVAATKGMNALVGGTPVAWLPGQAGATARDPINGLDYRYDTASSTWLRDGLVLVGSPSAPITNAATARPAGAIVAYWLCAAGVTPTNAAAGDLIWNAA